MKIFGFTIDRKKPNDDFVEVIELLQTINNRKLKHLHDCIDTICKSAKVPYQAPATFISDLEEVYLEEWKGKSANRLKKLVRKSFSE